MLNLTLVQQVNCPTSIVKMKGIATMPIVTVKKKYQVVIPQEVRLELNITEGDILEAKVEDGRLVYIPKVLVDRQASVDKIRTIAEEVEKRWRADGISDEEIDAMILEEVQTVRAEGYANGEYNK